MRHIEHIITGLDVGGAELMLSRLARGGSRFEHSVTALASTSHIAEDLMKANVVVRRAEVEKNITGLWQTRKLWKRLQKERPELVQTWLYHADLIGGLAARRAGLPVVWNLRQTSVGRGVQKLNTAIVIRLCALLSRVIPATIICGSKAALESHRHMGFDVRRMVVVSNGVDTRLFRPDPQARAQMRNELGLADDVLVVGRVGRYHAQKDYSGFVETARRISQHHSEAYFLVAGANIDWDNRELARSISDAGLSDRFCLLGARKDIARVMAAMDVFVSSSIFGEGFPNVIAEAMACGVPCVATHVGDSLEILGPGGRVVSAGDYPGLANAVSSILDKSPDERRLEGLEARRQVTQKFALDEMINNYETLYERIIEEYRESVIYRTGHGG